MTAKDSDRTMTAQVGKGELVSRETNLPPLSTPPNAMEEKNKGQETACPDCDGTKQVRIGFGTIERCDRCASPTSAGPQAGEYQMVPVEPTEEMKCAAVDAYRKNPNAAVMYRAMLAAAPKPPTSAGPQAGEDELVARLRSLNMGDQPVGGGDGGTYVTRYIRRSDIELAREAADEIERLRASPAPALKLPNEEVPREIFAAALKKLGMWVEPYVAPRESGVAIDMDISEDDAANFNDSAIKQLSLEFNAILSLLNDNAESGRRG